MPQFINVVIGLVTALIGYLIGRLWRTVTVRRRYWKARQFWQPVVEGHFQIVISRFEVAGFREPTGIVGGGDAIANRLLGDLFRDIGLQSPKSVYVDEGELDRNRNLIVLGGPNTNRVADEALSRISPGLCVTDPGPGVHMQVEDLRVAERPSDDGTGHHARSGVYVADPGSAEMTDYGVIIRARSPFKAERALVVISGAYGYGTWAGVELSQTAEFLRRCEECDAEVRTPVPAGLRQIRAIATRLGLRKSAVPQWAQVECLFKVDVIDKRPQKTQILLFRRIAAPASTNEPNGPHGRPGSSTSPQR